MTHSGYLLEEHVIKTKDGHLLNAYRIPGKDGDGPSTEFKQPVQLQHGLFDQGGTWFFNEPSKSLAFTLVDLGYDVWITNSRGTYNSKDHIQYNPNEHEFWNFTFADMAEYDVPANLEYILAKTGAEKLIYMGHSQGTV